VNLAKTQPDKLAEMRSIFQARNKTVFEAVKIPNDQTKCDAYAAAHGGFGGPYLSQ
jgi:hypothetical protein